MAFIEKFREYCGGSRILAWLVTVTVASGLLCWLATVVARLAGSGYDVVNSILALPSDPLRLLTHPWTLATYMLVHYSPLHLIFNVLWLYWFGRMLADTRSDKTLLVLFIGGGVAGGVFYSLTSWLSGNTGGCLTGDSAAVLSLMTATALFMPSRRIGLFLLGEVKLKWVAVACILITLLGGGGGFPSRAAHIGGVAFGALSFLYYRGSLRFPSIRRKVDAPRPPRVVVSAFEITPDHERLDQLLDKIRVSGYDSLSEKEKTELNYISSRIDNDKSGQT